MKILNLNLPALRNEEHFQFMTDTDGLIDNAGTEALQLVEPYAQFKVLLEQEDVALETILKADFLFSLLPILGPFTKPILNWG